MEFASADIRDFGGTDLERSSLGGTNVVFKHEKGSTTLTYAEERKPVKTAFIAHIATNPNPEALRQGGATKAVRSFVAWAEKNNFAEIYAQKVTDPIAIKFWESVGFRRKEEPNYNNLYKYVG